MQEFTPEEYLKIDIATNFGLDKENWSDRISWFENNKHHLNDFLDQAEEPPLYYAAVKAFQATQRNEEIGYPISLDATASGAQILSILMGCEKSARLCNVIDTGNRLDFYTEIFKYMKTNLNQTNLLSRQVLKDGMMPWFYGSEKLPDKMFGKDTEERQMFETTVQEEAPGLYALRNVLVTLWDPTALKHSWVLPDNFHVHVKVSHKQPLPFICMGEEDVAVLTTNHPKETGLSNAANTIHSVDGLVVREMGYRCMYDETQIIFIKKHLMRTSVNRFGEIGSSYKMNTKTKNARMVKTLLERYRKSDFLSARILNYIDQDTIYLIPREPLIELLESLPAKSFDILTNHDCFRCHPNYGNDLRRQYKQILYELAKSEILSDIVTQLCGEEYQIKKFGMNPKDILNSEYAIS